MDPSDWAYLFDKQSFILAGPGILAGIFLIIVSRKCDSDAVLPLSMVAIPLGFYAALFAMGMSMEDARERGWVGEVRFF